MEEEKLVFGAIPSPKDERDYIAMAEIPTAGLPVSVDNSDKIFKIKNQGNEGTCVANSVSYLKEFFDRTDLSVRDIYYHGRQLSGMNPISNPGSSDWKDREGMVPRDAMHSVKDRGVCRESVWPYKVFDKSTPPVGSDKDALSYRFASYAKVVTFNDMKAQLAKGQIVSVLVRIWDNGYNWYTNVVKQRNNTVLTGGNVITSGHEITCVGYDDNRNNPDGTIGAWKMANSWGEGWGDKGFFWLPYNYPIDEMWVGVDTEGVYSFKYDGQEPKNPVEIKPGETKILTLRLINDGTADWLPNIFRIGTSQNLKKEKNFFNDIDRPSLFYNVNWQWINRPATVDKVIKPGESYDFKISITAPFNSKVGNVFEEYFRPVVDGVMWLKDIGIYWQIKVI